jgi:putative FmdB family regulatory protein
MPTYEYACTECGERTEVVQPISDPPLTACPVCGGAVRRVFSPVGIVFKGSGFYRTDSRGRSSGASKGDGKADGKADGDKAKKDADSSSSSSKESKDSSSDGGRSSSTTKAAEKSA